MKILNFVLLVLLVVGCSKSTEVIADCEEKILNDFDMEKFENQDLACKNFLEAFDWHDRNWFVLQSNCAEIFAAVVDCQGNLTCDFDCENFWRDAKSLGIIGIER